MHDQRMQARSRMQSQWCWCRLLMLEQERRLICLACCRQYSRRLPFSRQAYYSNLRFSRLAPSHCFSRADTYSLSITISALRRYSGCLASSKNFWFTQYSTLSRGVCARYLCSFDGKAEQCGRDSKKGAIVQMRKKTRKIMQNPMLACLACACCSGEACWYLISHILYVQTFPLLRPCIGIPPKKALNRSSYCQNSQSYWLACRY